MKKLALILSIVCIGIQGAAQSEFETYKNGLIYSETTMYKLEHIVDSLNLRYKTCDLNKAYYSKSQTIGHTVTLDTGNIKQAKEDLENNISFDSFISKYPHADIKKDVLIVKYKYKNYKGEEIVKYSEVDLNSGYGIEIQRNSTENLYNGNVKDTWLSDYNEKTDYSKESINAFYFPSNFKSQQIALKYGRLIGYSDCLIDTSTSKFREDTEAGWVELPENWQSLSMKKKEKLLSKMRSTHVIGGCSMDSRPREHAMNIALLSAETTNWEVFLKSHLDIMNDKFDRVSDGSYAYAQRKTYIKELEELNINVLDLLLGISLRIENPATNHYYGSIGRLGRAISESNNKPEFEKEILTMVEDDQLDDFNRVLAYFLFISYNNYLEDKNEQERNIEKLNQSVAKLPAYIKEKIK
ncbi:MAG: hypothetical protein K0R26_2489 [Bacteroidota bacterium]|jgi:hypothetical protein|nr:hypothetical protein [Bacteroidota bacterium]